MDPPRFAGRVFGRLADGSKVPLPGVSFLKVTTGDNVIPTGIETDADGQFDAFVGISTSSSITTEGSKTAEHGGKIIESREWVEDVVIELRAAGCEPHAIHFSMQWEPQTIELNCETRSPADGRQS